MVSKEYVEKQLKDLKINTFGWGHGEYEQLPHIILPDEQIYEVVNGIYEGGFALLLSTDIRVLLVDKKPFSFLTVEDLRFDMINEIDYNHRVLGAYIMITTGNKVLNFRSYNKDRLRKLIGHVQHCMAEIKKKQSSHAEGQAQHLEKINEQLQTYLMAQQKQQQRLQDHLTRLQSGMGADLPQMPEPVKPAPELSDYLYSRGLLERYRKEHPDSPVEQPAESQREPEPARPPAPAPSPDSQLADMYADGLKEVFGKHQEEPARPAQAPSHGGVISGVEVSPFSIAYSKLPKALRDRKFGKPRAEPAN